MNQFGVVKGTVEIGNRQIGLEETPDRFEGRLPLGQLDDALRIKAELASSSQHLTHLPGESACPGGSADLLRPILLPHALEQIPEPLFLFRRPEQPEVLFRISQFS